LQWRLRHPPPTQADRWLALGRPHLPRDHVALYRPADGLDDPDLDQVRLCRHAIPAAMVAHRADHGELPEAARSAEQRRAGLPALLLEQPLRLLRDDDPRRRRRGAGGLCLLALQFPGPEVPLLLRAAAQHVPRRDLPRAAFHPDALARAGEYAWIA